MKKINASKKAQLTVFIIIGIVILLVFGLVYYILGAAKETSGRKEIEKTFERAITSDPIHKYITICVENTLEDGLLLLGKQGGVIFKEQGSLISSASREKVDFAGSTVVFLVIAWTPSPIDIPWYPCKSPDNPPGYCNFINDITKFPDLYNYSYGRSTLPSLEKGDRSIKKQLEVYIQNNLGNCVNLSSVLQLSELKGYDIIEGNVTPKVDFGTDYVAVIVDYPLTIKFADREISKIPSYGAKANIRFRKIYDAVENIIEYDNSYLDYRLVKDTETGYFMGDALDFGQLSGAALKRASVNAHDTILMINDSFSKIRGETYIFQFAIENRNPVLDYIEKKKITIGQPVDIAPAAADPDEDPLKIIIDGIPTSPYYPPEVGYTRINVSVSDGQLRDYQEVGILVCGLDHTGKNKLCDAECEAATQCDAKNKGYLTGECNNVGESYFEDMCSTECRLMDVDYCTGPCGAAECHGKAPYSLVPENYGWCQGRCEYCPFPVVIRGEGNPLEIAECGCNNKNIGSLCDADWNGEYEGTCRFINNFYQCTPNV